VPPEELLDGGPLEASPPEDALPLDEPLSVEDSASIKPAGDG